MRINALENERKIKSGEIIVDEEGGAFANQEEFIEFIADKRRPQVQCAKKGDGDL